LVAELEQVGKRFGDRMVVRDLSLRVMRGDRIGVIGPNGAGKTTLLKLIVGTLAPDEGTVRLGTRLQVAYFDQMRAQLDPDRTLADTISPGSEWIETASGRKHVLSYLADFLFAPQRAEAPVKMLSGGERNRLLLARLFALPANLLVLDEPTNDLDIESLELLEDTLQSYAGTLLLVSHDRAFLDNVVTQTLVAESSPGHEGRWKEYVGGYSDWLAQRPRASASASDEPSRDAIAPVNEPRATQSSRARLSFKERRELEGLPAELEALEREQHDLSTRMSAADYYKQGAEAIRRDHARAADIERVLADKFERWAELDARSSARS